MITFPCAKINLGLNIVAKRPDGYHDLETVFYPIPLTDAIEMNVMHHDYPLESGCTCSVDGAEIAGKSEDNLVVRAYNMVAQHYDIPRVHIHLYKRIPMQAGLGGGSSDAAYVIRMLDEKFHLSMGLSKMEHFASKLGADCAFFITAEPAYATGIGEKLYPIGDEDDCGEYLDGYWLALVKPPVAISTKEAFAGITPKKPKKCCRDIVLQPIETWKDELVNDFEESIFANHPELSDIKETLYKNGAIYAAMSGSGSCLYGIFKEKPECIEGCFDGCQCFVMEM